VGVSIFIYSFFITVILNSGIDVLYNKFHGLYIGLGVFQYFEIHLINCLKSEPNRDSVILIILMFLISYITPAIRNKFISDHMIQKLYKEVISTIPYEAMLYDAVTNYIPVMINMTDNRFYIGIIYYEGAYIRRRETISIIPLRSGYRNSGNHLVFTTNYAVTFFKYYKELEKKYCNETMKDSATNNSIFEAEYNRFNDKMKKIIFLNQIETMTLFDFDIYEKYFKNKEK